MVVTDLGDIVGLGVNNSCGAWGNIRIAGVGLGLCKISWGKNLKGTVIFGWLALLMVLLSSGCLRLCCMDRKPGFDTKTNQLHNIRASPTIQLLLLFSKIYWLSWIQ
nr:hypothetical protein CFP56_29803 [Quercus suber]